MCAIERQWVLAPEFNLSTSLWPAGSPWSQRGRAAGSVDHVMANSGYHQQPGGHPAHALGSREATRPRDAHSAHQAPAFGQPGEGRQLMLDGRLVESAPERVNVHLLPDSGYLREVRVGLA